MTCDCFDPDPSACDYDGFDRNPWEKQPSKVDRILIRAERSVTEIGIGLMAGTSLGSVYHFLKASLFPNNNILNSITDRFQRRNNNIPNSLTELFQRGNNNNFPISKIDRFQHGLAMARAHAPRVGARWAAFFSVFSVVKIPVCCIQSTKDKFSWYRPYSPTVCFLCSSLSAAFVSMQRGPIASLHSGLLVGSFYWLFGFYQIYDELSDAQSGIEEDRRRQPRKIFNGDIDVLQDAQYI